MAPLAKADWSARLAQTIVGKRVLITGASSGIGRELAILYALHGAVVCITSPEKERPLLDGTRAEAVEAFQEGRKRLPGAGAGEDERDSFALCLTYDATEPGGGRRLVEAAVAAFAEKGHGAGLDIVVLNHAVTTTFRILGAGPDRSFEACELVNRVNFVSHVEVALHALPYLKQSATERKASGHPAGLKGSALREWVGSRLVEVSSFSARIPSIKVAAYAAAKAAVTHYFTNLRLELDHHPKYRGIVTVTVPLLGPVTTPTYMTSVVQDHPRLLKIVKHMTPREAAGKVIKVSARGMREPSIGVPKIVAGVWNSGGPLASAFEWFLVLAHGGHHGSVAPTKEEIEKGDD
ncbi:NAD(P)-binding protein [Gonapodya prolifera JEL478]|uniref:NAD(P)-binding protein n=1 Tax=Gonapodya prolifera (strain JEL478) TaxID=1344416 RepID=A0A138ZXH0_GONPJ|nr:NAD(P)-binding protein [Gonapodya prolifera JEL478]|eukprot:KXS09189.1 NAD(P)-binding protein [Gonapodya prolifera JEL478]